MESGRRRNFLPPCNVLNAQMERQGLSYQRAVQIHAQGPFLDLLDTHEQPLVRRFHHENSARLERIRWRFSCEALAQLSGTISIALLRGSLTRRNDPISSSDSGEAPLRRLSYN